MFTYVVYEFIQLVSDGLYYIQFRKVDYFNLVLVTILNLFGFLVGQTRKAKCLPKSFTSFDHLFLL